MENLEGLTQEQKDIERLKIAIKIIDTNYLPANGKWKELVDQRFEALENEKLTNEIFRKAIDKTLCELIERLTFLESRTLGVGSGASKPKNKNMTFSEAIHAMEKCEYVSRPSMTNVFMYKSLEGEYDLCWDDFVATDWYIA